MDMSMRKGYRIAFGCIGLGFLVLFALVGWDDEEQTLIGFMAMIGVCLMMLLMAIFWPQFVRWRAGHAARLKSGAYKPHRDKPLRTFLGGLVAFLLCGWMFYPTSMKDNTVLALLSVAGVSMVTFLHGWWSDKQGPKTAALSSLVLTVLLAPLLVFSEDGPHYLMIPFLLVLTLIVAYGQYRMLRARVAGATTTEPQEPSEEEAIVEEEEPSKEEEA